MAYTTDDHLEILDSVDTMLNVIYDNDLIPQVAGRKGNTASHMKRQSSFNGRSTVKKLMTGMLTNARASATLEGPVPEAQKITVEEVTIDKDDFRRLTASIKMSEPVMMNVDGKDENAIWDLANEKYMETETAIAEVRNQRLNGDGDAVKAVTGTPLDLDASPISGNADVAYLPLTSGSTSMFHEGEIIDTRDPGSGDVGIQLLVKAVVHDGYYLGVSMGSPGIIVATEDGSSYDDAHCDDIASGDELVASGEANGDGFPGGFDLVGDLTGATAYFGLDRDSTAPQNFFLVAAGRDYGGATLDIAKHLGAMSAFYGQMLTQSRQRRMYDKFDMTEAIVCQASPKLLDDIVRQAGDGRDLFTSEHSSSLSEAKKKKLIAVQGWDGVILRHPHLPPLALESESLMPNNQIRAFDPNAWEFVRMGGMKPNWHRSPGVKSRWHTVRDSSTGRIENVYEAGCSVYETPFCDIPKMNYFVKDVEPELDVHA